VDERFAALEARVLEGMAGGGGGETVLLGGDFNSKVAMGVGRSSGLSRPKGQNKHGSLLLEVC
jgi:hypothetical protein